MLAMAGEKHRHLIVLSIPGILLGGLDFGATDSPSALYVSTDAGKTFEQVNLTFRSSLFSTQYHKNSKIV